MTSPDDVVTSTKTMTSSEMTQDDLDRLRLERLVRKIQAYFFRFLLAFQAVTQLYVTEYYLLDFAFVNFSSLTRSALRLWAWHLCVVGTINWLCLMYYRCDYNPAEHHPETTYGKEEALLLGTTRNRNTNSADDTPASTAVTNTTISIENRLSNNGEQNITGTGNNSSANNSETFEGQIYTRAEVHASRSDSDHPNDASTGLRDGERATAMMDPEKNEGKPLSWTYCHRCQMVTPPRTRHCKKCETCVVRRDHHCELVGQCVGHRNQRFFLVLANYGIFVTYIGAYMTLTYLYHHHPEDMSLWNYFLPITFFQGLMGNISGLQVLLTYHAFMLLIFCPLTAGYFFSELSIVLQGKTMHEVMKKMKHIKVTSRIADRFWVVFGDHWWLNFIFPTHFFLPHPHNGMDFEGVAVFDPPPPPTPTTTVTPPHTSGDKKQD